MTVPGLGPILESNGEAPASASSSAGPARSGEAGAARPSPTAKAASSPTPTSITSKGNQDDDPDDARRRRELEAATAIQRRWKGHKARVEHAEVKLYVGRRRPRRTGLKRQRA
jgi:hypothetical protein